MYYFVIDWISRTCGREVVVEEGQIPLHIVADTQEDALAQATKLAQGMARAFNDTKIRFYYRIML